MRFRGSDMPPSFKLMSICATILFEIIDQFIKREQQTLEEGEKGPFSGLMKEMTFLFTMCQLQIVNKRL